jgi:hypothetical protein
MLYMQLVRFNGGLLLKGFPVLEDYDRLLERLLVACEAMKNGGWWSPVLALAALIGPHPCGSIRQLDEVTDKQIDRLTD